MTSLRRRLHHGDVDGRKYEHVERDQSDYLNEPLLGSYKDDYSEVWGFCFQKKKYGGEDDTWDDDDKKADLHWSSLFSNLISQWAQWLAQVVLGSGSVIGRLLPIPFINAGKEARFEVSLSPLQEERLRTLQQRLEVPFDSSILEHQDALKQLWRLSYPGRELPPLKSELWKEMGWQGTDPSTDFRGGGYISLENLIFFAKEYPESFQRLLHKTEGTRADWEYPFAVAGVNISFTLVQMLNLHSGKPSSIVSSNFMTLLAENEMAFDNLFCVAFELMDAQWLAKRASYMEFNDVLKATRQQLERELSLEDVHTIKDIPAYTLLNR